MAEEEQVPEEEPKEQKSPKLLRTIIIVGIMVLVPAILALVTYNFIVAPMVAASEGEGEVIEDPDETIPANAMSFIFPEAQATVITTEPDASSPLLIYQVALICADQATYTLIEAKQTWFESTINRLHRNRTRQELNDPVMQETLLKQMKQEANQLIRKFNPGGSEEILEVMHIKFAIFDL